MEKETRIYLTYGDFYETGVGRAVWLSFERAGTENEAIAAAMKRFELSKYFKVDFEAFALCEDEVRVREIMENYIDARYAGVIIDAGTDFQFHFHFNRH